jgi:uncharacterized protein (DUF58 family)
VTARGFALAAASALCIGFGWRLGWPELTALGGAGVALVAITVAWAARAPRASLAVVRDAVRATRGDHADVRISVSVGRRRRWLRLVDGRVARPAQSVGMPKGRQVDPVAASMPLDTSRRGQWTFGPYSLVYGDPWSVVRRVVSVSEGGSLTVVPRVHPLRSSVLARVTVPEAELSSRRFGDQHFHALRDYVLGDEPRNIHWRSSARTGHLVVRQQVASATNGTSIILDTSSAVYGSDERFGSGLIEDRFEQAVEVAASLCVADVGRDEPVHLLTTSQGSALFSAVGGAPSGFLDVLATVAVVSPVDAVPEALTIAVRRARCARAILVTGKPSQAMLDVMRRLRQAGISTVVIRIGATSVAPLPGLRVVDVATADELDVALSEMTG